MGDCNIDYLKPKDLNTFLKWVEQSTGLKQLMKKTFRYSTIDSCIDLIFTNCLKVKDIYSHDFNISDHQMISIFYRNHSNKN